MKQPLPYRDALPIAQHIQALLLPACDRIEIAGSLRRQKSDVGDIELVAVPKWTVYRDLFGEELGRKSLIEDALGVLRITPLKNGDRFKQFEWEGMTVDLFLVTPETWGLQFAIRTGCADFSHWLVAPVGKGGALPWMMRVSEGRLWNGDGTSPDTPEEANVFEAIGLPFLSPERRIKGFWGSRA